MKNIIRKSVGAVLLSATFLTTNALLAQTSVMEETTTTSAGTISEFSPTTIMIRTEASPDPVSYSYSKTTTYVDEAGAPVSMDMVKSGRAVTVYYTTVDGKMVASKVIVRKAVISPSAPVVEETKTTTTTTSEE